MITTLYRTSSLCKQLLQVKNMSTTAHARSMFLQRLFCTDNSVAESEEHQCRQAAQKQTLEFSPSETEAILHKLNASPADELSQLEHVTVPCANAIVTYRDIQGHFKLITDLLAIPHIGPKKLPKICQCITRPHVKLKQSSKKMNLSLSPIDIDKILQTFNKHSAMELAVIKPISLVFANLIVEHHGKNGDFESIDNLLQIPGMMPYKLRKICQSILNPTMKPGSDYIKSLDELQRVCDLVTLDIGLKHIAWLHMTRDREVSQWMVYNIETISPLKWQPQEYFNVVKDVQSQLPSADLYLMEHQPNFGNAKKDIFLYVLYKKSLEAMFLGLLNADIHNCSNLGAVSVSQNIAGRHFGLLVGSNRSSNQQFVQQMLNEQQHGVNRFTMDNHVAKGFQTANKFQKEHMGNCLLQAIAFFDNVGFKQNKH